MMRNVRLLLAVLLFATPLYAQTPWIHVEVDEGGADESHVKVNLPLSVVRVALEAAPEKVASEGRIQLGRGDVEVEDLRRMWRELKAAGEAELASVESDDETVVIRRDGDVVKVEVAEGRKGTEVFVEIPVDVIDALLEGDGNELDVLGALDRLKDRRGELVRVADGETRVRIWIDEK